MSTSGATRGSSGFGAWLLTLTSAGIVNRLVLWPRPAHDPVYEVEGASEIQDHVSRRELAGVRDVKKRFTEAQIIGFLGEAEAGIPV